MTRTTILVACTLLIAAVPVAADTIAELDRLHEEEQHERIVSMVDTQLPSARTNSERAALIWRLARAKTSLADFGRWSGSMSDSAAMELLQEAEADAQQAIELDSSAAAPWFWKGAAMGLRGQLRGVLNSLFMASDVRDHAVEAINRDDRYGEAYYLLGQLFRELPGRPLSFGNRDAAVSLLRKAGAIHEQEYRDGVVGVRYFDNHNQLARALWKRNHSEARRRRNHEQAADRYRSATTALERGSAFEGSQPLPPGSDREEAVRLVEKVVDELSGLSQPGPRERKDLESARELLSDWS